jgi:hypothetical protein
MVIKYCLRLIDPVETGLPEVDLDFYKGFNIKGIDSISRDIENELMVYFIILILLYADDTILLSESKDDLQIMLN